MNVRRLILPISVAFVTLLGATQAFSQSPEEIVAEEPSSQSAGVTLAPDVAASLAKIPTDPRPEQITRNIHYTTSNETRHYLFEGEIKDDGGIYIGVGAEQNYIFAGWSRPEILILMDFDQWIVDLHHAYSVIFKHAATPREFLAHWSKKNKKETQKLIAAEIPNKRLAKRVQNVFKYSRPRVNKHLWELRKLYKKERSKIFLTDQEHYDFLKGLVEAGRVRPVRGDLTAAGTMKGIAAFAKKHSIHIGTLYLSNAEYYFTFKTGRYRRNILDLPFDERSTVLHTHPYGGVHYRYIYHSGHNFQEWLKSRKVSAFRGLMKYSRRQKDKDLRRITRGPNDRKRR
jgi:hypothetical protein